MKRMITLLLAAALTFSTAACGGCGNNGAGSSSPTPEEGNDVLTLCLGPEPESLDPAQNETVDGGSYLVHVFEGIYRRAKGDALELGQAKEVVKSEDGLTYTITLRDDIKWSDGKEVTADDFIYAWKRAVDPATAAPYAVTMMSVLKNGADIISGENPDIDSLGVKALDPQTLEIRLEAPCAYFEELLAFPTYFPLRKDVVDGNDSWATSPETYLSNGPYTMKKWTHNAEILLEQNPHYYDKEKLGSNTLRFVLMEDDTAILSAFKNGDILFGDTFPIEEIDAMKATADFHAEPQIGTYFICFNTDKAPFDDARVRKALSLAIDRNFLCDQISKDGRRPANAYVAPGSPGQTSGSQFRDDGGPYFKTDDADYEANCAEAKELLAQAGFPEGKGFPTFTYILNINTEHQAYAEALQNMWKTVLGVDCQIAAEEWGVFVNDRQQGNYDVARHGWLADYADPVSFLDMWMTGNGNNNAAWSNKEYDRLVGEALSSSDPAVRFPSMHAAEKILMEELPIAPLVFYTDIYLLSPRVQGMYTSPLGFKFFQYATAD